MYALSIARSEHHSFEPCGQIVAFDSSKDASQGRVVNKSWGRGHQFPLPTPSLSLPFIPSFPPSLASTVQPALFSLSPLLSLPFPPLPSPSHPLHSLPLPLEVGLLIAANGSGSALAPQAGLGPLGRARQPNGIWFILN